jgi:phospholipid/cholesterol/gamma-HCH transport system substrate-binding protein
MKISNETKVGVLAAIAITILIVGYNFMKGESLFSSNKTYYAVYQKIDGLFRSNPVVINGFKVGHVSSVKMDEITLELVVSIQISGTIKVPANSILKLTNNDLLGSKAIEIIMGNDSTNAMDGDTLSSDKDAGMAQALTSVLSPLSERVNSVLSGIDTALSDVSLNSTLSDLSDALYSFKQTSVKLSALMDGKSEKLDGILNNVEGITGDIKSSTPKIKDIVTGLEIASNEIAKLDMNGISEQLTATIGEIQATLSAIREGQGSLGKLANNDDLWIQLNNTTKSLDSLAKDMQRYPRRYFGITEKQRKKGDEQKEFNENLKLPKEIK